MIVNACSEVKIYNRLNLICRRGSMLFFTKGDSYVEYQNGGETLRLMGWGKNSLRVVSVPNGQLDLAGSALLPQSSPVTVTFDDQVAEITNGSISAVIDTRGWNSAAVVTFFNDRKEVILKELEGGGALVRRARHFLLQYQAAGQNKDYHLLACSVTALCNSLLYLSRPLTTVV